MNLAEQISKYRPNLSESEQQITCYAPFTAVHIDKHGKVRPCPFSFIREEDLAEKVENKYKWNEPDSIPKWRPDKSLRDIWNGKTFEKLREECIDGNLKNGECMYCINSILEKKPPSSLDFDWVGGRRNIDNSIPKELELELSSVCNLMCLACGPCHSTQHMKRLGLDNDPNYRSVFEDNDDYRLAFVEDLRSMIHEIYRVNFTGGEPFAQRIVYDILNMIEEENPSKLRIHFTTNGNIMNGAVKKLAKKKSTRFTISLDSIDPEVYPILRVNGSFKDVMNNIEFLLKQKAQLGCSFVVSKHNVRDLPNIVSWCNERSIEFSYHIISNMGGSWEQITPISPEFETDEYKQELKDYLKSRIGDIKVDPVRNPAASSEDWEKWDVQNKNIKMFKQYIERIK